MGVKFTPKFTQNDIRNFIRQRVQIVENTVLDQLKQVAEEFVADARTTNTYTDRTRNLRGSIGYVILKDGKEIYGDFDGTKEGTSEGRKLVEGIVAEYPRGYALIVVAGMTYAVHVEAKGFDVLTGSSQIASGNLKKSFDQLKKALSKLKK